MRKSTLLASCVVALVAILCLTRQSRLAAEPAEHDAALLPAVGSNCLVYLRGDAAGVAYHDRIVDLGNLISRKGVVVRADDTWLVLKEGDQQLFVPRTSIMLIETSK